MPLWHGSKPTKTAGPVLDPVRETTKTAYLWVLTR